VLRHATPAMHLVRTVTRPWSWADGAAEGDTVCVWLASANRDERVFADPDSFRVDRQPNPHLAFSMGPHFCLGSVLARLELRTALEELATRVRTIAVLEPPSCGHRTSSRRSTGSRWADAGVMDDRPPGLDIMAPATGRCSTARETSRRDERVRALWLYGSLAKGIADAASDLDFIVGVRDDDHDSFTAEWRRCWRSSRPPCWLARSARRSPASTP